MALAIPLSLALGRFKQLAQRSGEVWQGAVVRFPMWVVNEDDPDGPPVRPTGALWASVRTGLIHLDLAQNNQPPSADLALSTFLEFGLKWARGLEGRPGRVEVQNLELRESLAGPLATLDTPVALVSDLPAVRDAVHQLEARETGGRLPGILESPGVSVDRLRAFADAAAIFFAARPWEQLSNEDLLVVDGARVPQQLRHVCVLGRGGQQFGLAFFDERAAFERLLTGADTGRQMSRAHGVTFGAMHEMPFADHDAWLDHALPVAGAGAYPVAADISRNGSFRRPDAGELTHSEAVLRALAATTEDELDAGTWRKRVETFDGPVDLTLTLPFLVEAEAGKGTRRITALPRAAAEREVARISRLLGERSFESLDEVNAELARLNDAGTQDEIPPARELTPLERAQDVAYDAMEVQGRLRLKRARQALALSPDCADAWVLLAEEAMTPAAALELYERALQAGEKAIGAERFASLRGSFWGHVETRPYMRARLGIAGVLRNEGRYDEALAHYRALLELNPHDNQGVRYLLLTALLALDRNEEAGLLLAEYENDGQALWPYARLLWQFRTDRDPSRLRAAYDAASAANAHVLHYLLNPESTPFSEGSHFALGSREEAAYVVDEIGDMFDGLDGAIDWIYERGRDRPVRGRRRRRSPK
jgi:tetratricopeptide (TPR) repeat protein